MSIANAVLFVLVCRKPYPFFAGMMAATGQ